MPPGKTTKTSKTTPTTTGRTRPARQARWAVPRRPVTRSTPHRGPRGTRTKISTYPPPRSDPTVRDLAHQPGTLFYRLLTDQHGNLLETCELGRFPSRTLGGAVRFRDGTCQHPGCAVPAHRCDLDHLTPVPEGPTTAGNLGCKCRSDHRAKTHAGHVTTRRGPHTTVWTTPTGHTYTTHDDPLPAENWPDTGS